MAGRPGICAVLLALTLSGCVVETVPDDGEQPIVETEDLEELTRQALKDYRLGIRQSAEDTSRGIREGYLKSGQEVLEEFGKLTRNVRLNAFHPVENQFQRRFPTPQSWDAQKAAQMFDEIAEGAK